VEKNIFTTLEPNDERRLITQVLPFLFFLHHCGGAVRADVFVRQLANREACAGAPKGLAGLAHAER